MKFTIRHLASVAKGYGYAGKDDDWQAMKRHLLDRKGDDNQPDAITAVNFNGEEIDIKGLVFDEKPARPMRNVVSLMVDDEAEDVDAKLAAAVDARLKAMGIDGTKGKRLPPITDKTVDRDSIGAVKSGDERQYDGRIKLGSSAFKSFDMAYAFGSDIQMKTLRALNRHHEADELYKKVAEQITQKGYTLLTTASGSALVPEGFDADLHQLLLQYGVARKAARVVNMTSEIMTRPKATGDLIVYYPADGTAGTESTKTWSNVQLRAKEGMVIVKASRALVQDAAINVADDAGRDIVRAIAKVEDRSLFNSDGSGVANNYIPNTQGILNIISETSTGARVYKAAATTPGAVTITELANLMGTPGNFIGKMMAFHCTPQIGGAIFGRIAASTGGIQPMMIEGLGQVLTYMNFPIIYNNVMTTNLGTGANRQLMVFGDISLAADFGDRMGLTVEISEQRYWDENNIGVKGTVRHDLNVHGLGASTDTGPLAVLIQT